MDIKSKYTYVTNNKDETQCIGLTPEASTFQGVIYKYGKVSAPNPDELNSEGDLPLRFDYDIVDNNSLPEEWLRSDEFHTLIGDILVDIMDEQLTKGTLNFANTDD